MSSVMHKGFCTKCAKITLHDYHTYGTYAYCMICGWDNENNKQWKLIEVR